MRPDRVPTGRPRKYQMPEIAPGQHVTGDLIREIAPSYTGNRMLLDALPEPVWRI